MIQNNIYMLSKLQITKILIDLNIIYIRLVTYLKIQNFNCNFLILKMSTSLRWILNHSYGQLKIFKME